jgi:hypothetical protein
LLNKHALRGLLRTVPFQSGAYMKYMRFIFIGILFNSYVLHADLADTVAFAIGNDNLDDALFIYKSLKVNNHTEQGIAYQLVLRKFKKDVNALQQALDKIPMAGSMTADKYKGHAGPQAIDDMIEMFLSGPGSAVYKKLARTETQAKEAIDKVTTALEETKSLLP